MFLPSAHAHSACFDHTSQEFALAFGGGILTTFTRYLTKFQPAKHFNNQGFHNRACHIFDHTGLSFVLDFGDWIFERLGVEFLVRIAARRFRVNGTSKRTFEPVWNPSKSVQMLCSLRNLRWRPRVLHYIEIWRFFLVGLYILTRCELSKEHWVALNEFKAGSLSIILMLQIMN